MAFAQAQGCLRYHRKAGFQDAPLRQTDLGLFPADWPAVNCGISQPIFAIFTKLTAYAVNNFTGKPILQLELALLLHFRYDRTYG
jgi:hypothetical protein